MRSFIERGGSFLIETPFFINITQKLIDESTPQCHTECPTANALLSILPEDTFVYVESTHADISHESSDVEWTIVLPSGLRDWIIDYDDCKGIRLQSPFTTTTPPPITPILVEITHHHIFRDWEYRNIINRDIIENIRQGRHLRPNFVEGMDPHTSSYHV